VKENWRRERKDRERRERGERGEKGKGTGRIMHWATRDRLIQVN